MPQLWSGLSISTFSTSFYRFDASWIKYGFSEHFSWRKLSSSLHPLQNNFPSLTIKFSPGNCLTRSHNGTFVVSLFPLRWQFPLVDSKDRSRAIVERTGLCSPSEFPSMSCKYREHGVALADAILFVPARERPLKFNHWPAALSSYSY